MTDTTIRGISPFHLLWAVILFMVSGGGMAAGGAMAWSDIKSSIKIVSDKQDKQDIRLDRIEARQNLSDAKIDTISHRQELNQLKQDYQYKFQAQTNQSHPRTQWMEERYRSK